MNVVMPVSMETIRGVRVIEPEPDYAFLGALSQLRRLRDVAAIGGRVRAEDLAVAIAALERV